MAGRNSKLNPERQQKICDALRAGNTRRVAAILGGISEATFYNWIEWANPESENYSEEYLEFLESVTRAEAEAEAEHVKNIQVQGIGDWRASVEWLKRRRPKEWSEKVIVEQTNFNIDLSTLTDDELDEYERDPAAFIAKKGRGRAGEETA